MFLSATKLVLNPEKNEPPKGHRPKKYLWHDVPDIRCIPSRALTLILKVNLYPDAAVLTQRIDLGDNH